MEKSWVEIKTGLSFSSYHHGQNRHDLGKINLFYCKLKYFWQWESTSPCSVLILHSGLLSFSRGDRPVLYVSVVRQSPCFGCGSPEAQLCLLQGQIQISKHRLFPTENYFWNKGWWHNILSGWQPPLSCICLVMGMPQPLDWGIQGFLTLP